jgi:prepilin-type N-terminal cleavage/methylation domain-containing protein
MKYSKQNGFSIVETLIVLLVIAVLGFVGYKVYSRQHDNKATTTASSQPASSATANDVAKAPDIKTTGDLDKAAATLDQTDPAASNSDSSQLSDSF